MDKMDLSDIEQKLTEFPEWSLNGETLQRTFSFDDFNVAMGFVNRVADLAEALQHHPDIMVRYNKVTLTVTTHDADGLTDKDFSLARDTDACVAAA